MNQLTLTGNDLSNICRLCLTRGDSMTDIFCFSSKFGEYIADVVMKCAPVQNITKNERMPKYICQLCYNQLENVRKFQTQAVQSERTLLQYLQQLDASDRQTSPGCSNKISSDDSVNENSGAQVSVKVEIAEPNDRLNEDNDEEATESSHEQSDFYENINTDIECDVQIKQEDGSPLIDTSSKGDDDEDIQENFESPKFADMMKSLYKCQDNVQKPYQCDVCNKHFGQFWHLHIHKRTHTGEKPFQCDVCLKSFTQSGHLTAHKLTHTDEKPYKCDICNKCFIQSRYLKNHKRTHTDEKPYRCDICSKGYTFLHNLNSHKRTHTGEKPYQCDFCNKSFIDLSLLNRHKLIHTGEKPYQCDVCNKCFTQSSHLKGHKLTHTDEKPYQCDVCEKCFIQSSHLNRHKLTHTGEKKHQCGVCNKFFRREEHLNKHKLIHTNVKPFDFCKVEPID